MSDISFNEINEIIGKKLNKFFPISNCFIEVNPGHVLLPRKYADIGKEIRNLPVFNDDIWVISYPRTGSTWAQEMIWLLGNNLDYEGAKKIQQIRAPVIELTALFSEDHHEWVSNSMGNSVDCIKNLSRPRFIRSHLPWDLLPKEFETVKPKIIYTARNPKDLCVSFYHYCKLVHGLSCTLDEFCELFINDNSPVGSYWLHVIPFWKKFMSPDNANNILFLKYEDMRRDLRNTIKLCAEFLKIDYELTSSDLDRMCEHLKFDKMQSNPAVNLDPIIKNHKANLNNSNNLINNNSHEEINNESNNYSNCNHTNNNDDNNSKTKFIRKGQIGDWKNHISDELSEKFNEWIEKNTRGTGLTFDYE